jgi:EAL domain-containing protein (putative c-di-GMP-specific phosphodiesterase class I)
MGITIALDDFGSGYTSLATLRFLPVDILKIDRSIVNELQPDRGQSLVRLIIEAAHEFGMTVVAEGVEHEMQRELLHRLGCEQVQGWLFSPAVEPGRARELVAPVVG